MFDVSTLYYIGLVSASCSHARSSILIGSWIMQSPRTTVSNASDDQLIVQLYAKTTKWTFSGKLTNGMTEYLTYLSCSK